MRASLVTLDLLTPVVCVVLCFLTGVACTFLLYSTLTAFALAFVIFKAGCRDGNLEISHSHSGCRQVPETMGRSLEDIARLFRRRQPHVALA